MNRHKRNNVLIVVAHPDDETLWAGGTIMNHSSWNCYIVSLCRGDDADRAPRFFRALQEYGSEGIMGTLDDGPEQTPLDEIRIEQTILDLLPVNHFNLIISHNPDGEYTRHLRHEETGKAVIRLWNKSIISAQNLWTFAYNDGNKAYLPGPVENASFYTQLSHHIWLRKYRIITEIYGFDRCSFEAETTPKAESFWQFMSPSDAGSRFNLFDNHAE